MPKGKKHRSNGRKETAKERAFRERKEKLDRQRRGTVEESGNKDAQKENQQPSDSEEDSVDSEFEGSFLPTDDQPPTKRARSESSQSDNDEEPAPSALSESFYNKKKDQRSKNHPKTYTMAPRRSPRKKAGSRKATSTKKSQRTIPRKRRQHEDPDPEEEYNSEDSRTTIGENRSQNGSNMDAKLKAQQEEIERLKFRVKNSGSKSGSRKNKSGTKSTVSAEEQLVSKTTKTDLFKVCKFIADNDQLLAATRIVMNTLDLQCLEGLSGTDLIKAEETWIADNKDTVRNALNDWRNYVVGEFHKLFFDKPNGFFPAKRMKQVPNPEEILELACRLNLQDGDPNVAAMRVKFDTYWDELVPKVASHACWGPGKRHQGLMSFMRKFDSPDEPLYVSPSDEAFLVVLWENGWKRWHYLKELKDKGKKLDKEAKEAAGYQTPYTVPQGGVQQFGGWNKAGRKRYREVLKLIKDSKDQAHVEQVEQAALDRIRAHHNCAEKEANRKKPKNPDKIVEPLDSDHEPDWM